jgi:dTDP-4-amino-4,6-dideoxygalactose transaminase
VVRYKGQTADILRMLSHKNFTADDRVRLLEKRFADFLGVRHALAVSSGRVSLEVIFAALDFPAGGQVILPAYTYHSVPEAIKNVGLVPVFADIDPQDNNLDPARVTDKIGPKTVAVLATHIFGHPCRLDRLTEICETNNIALLEDCAHTIGGKFHDQNVGTFGRAGFFSFAATKVFNTYGGGMIVTNDDALADKMRKALDTHRPADKSGLLKTIISFSILHWLTRRWPFTLTVYPALWAINALNLDLLKIYGSTFKRTAEAISVPVKYSNLQAALALKQLDQIENQNRLRRQNAQTLLDQLPESIARLTPVAGATSVWYFFAIGVQNPERVSKALFRQGIDTGKNIMDHCAELSGSTESFAHTKWWREHSIQIPIHPPLTTTDMRKIAKAVRDTVESDKESK